MDWLKIREGLPEVFRRYRLVVVVILLGVLFMAIPEGKGEPVEQTETRTAPAPDLESALSSLLSSLEGAGEVRVLLTQQVGQQITYQVDEDRSGAEIRRDTVLVTDGDRNQQGLIRQVDQPVYRGAVVLSQGADQPAVRLALVEAVKSATGLTSEKITVLKMK